MSGLLAKIGAGVAWAATEAARISLLRVELDDELFLNGKANIFALRHVGDRTEELIGGQLRPGRNPAATGRFDRLPNLLVLAALLADLDRVSLADLGGGGLCLPSGHLGGGV